MSSSFRDAAMREFDVIVIGGGPGGAGVATMIARAGHDVALFERQAFPRFQIGESLVPAVNLTLEKLGVLDRMDGRRFPRKHAVQFFSPSGPTRPFYFSEVEDPRMHSTWQVLRSDFDAMLIENAKDAGVQVFTETEVVDVHTKGEETVTGVEIRNVDGRTESVRSKVLIDASGQQSVLAKWFPGRKIIAGLENLAVYAHYKNVTLDTGIDAGSTLIYRVGGSAWLWFIPLPDTVSIGLVAPSRGISKFGSSPEDILANAIAASKPLQERMTEAERTTDVKGARDYSYRMTKDGGPGWALVGDALGFIDPIYSSGLLLTAQSAELGANAIDRALQSSNGTPPNLAGYSKEYQTAFDQFLVLVHAFYTEDFHFGELAKDPDHRQGLVDLLTGIVGTSHAENVTKAIRASLGTKIVL